MKPSTAHRLITDPEVQELLTGLRKEVYVDFAKTDPTDQAGLTACRLRLDGIDRFQGRLNTLAHSFSRDNKQE